MKKLRFHFPTICSNFMFKLEELTEYTLEAFQHEGLNYLGRKMWDKGRGRFPIV